MRVQKRVSYRSLLLACLLSAGMLPTPSSAQGDEAARLLPTDAAVVLRLESVQALDELMRAFAPLVGEGQETPDLQSTFDLLASDEARDDPAGLPRLAPDLPLYVALLLDPSKGVGLTIVLPVENGRPLRFGPSFTTGLEHHASLGSYAGVSTDVEYAVSDTPSPLVAALRPGVVSVHVDLASVISAFRPLIEMGLQQAEASLDQIPPEAAPFDLEPLMELYLDTARAVVDAAEALDLTFVHRGGQLEISGAYLQREEAAPRAVGELAPLLGLIDPTSSIQVAYSGSWTRYFRDFENLLDAVLEIYPQPLRSDLIRVMDQLEELDPLVAPGIVSGVDFAPGGTHAVHAMRSSQPAQLSAQLESLVRGFDHEGGFVRCGPTEPLGVEGLEGGVFSLEIQHESLVHVFEGMAGAEAELPPEARQNFLEMMETLYGKDLRLALAHRGEIVLLCFGVNDTLLRTDLSRLSAPAMPSSKLRRLVDRIQPGACGLAYHFDVGQTMGQFLDAMRALMPAPVLFPRTGASLDFWGSAHGRTWSGGMSMDLLELIEFVRQVRALDER